MVRRNGSTKPRRRRAVSTRKGRKPALRKIHQSLSLRPYACRIAPDPPRALRTFQHSTVLHAQLITAPSGNTKVIGIVGTDEFPAIFVNFATDGKSLTSTGLSWHNIGNLIQAWLRIGTAITETSYEFSLHKVQYWGPSARDWPLCQIGLDMDFGSPFGHMAVRDVGTDINRPRVGIAVPYHSWYASGDSICLAVIPDPAASNISAHNTNIPTTGGTIIGQLQFSITLRVGEATKPPLVAASQILQS